MLKFQFPSNGKARVNWATPSNGFGRCIVSIPFKRESTCEHGKIGAYLAAFDDEFQFPSNGKARVNIKEFVDINRTPQFQFPSNGKARVNMTAI